MFIYSFTAARVLSLVTIRLHCIFIQYTVSQYASQVFWALPLKLQVVLGLHPHASKMHLLFKIIEHRSAWSKSEIAAH